MSLGESEKREVVVGLIGFVCEDGVAYGGEEDGYTRQEDWHPEAHVQ